MTALRASSSGTSRSATATSSRTTTSRSRSQPGEIHAILGENGAGKSTLMKIVYGAVAPDAGELLWNGAPVEIRSPHDARALGIAMVFQHFSLFDSLTVAENVWLGLSRAVSLREVVRRHPPEGGRVRPRPRPRPAGARALGRRAPARRDRPGAPRQPAAPDPRRADRRCSRRRRSRSSSRRCASSPRPGARSSTSATSSTRSGRCATAARCCAAAAWSASCDPAQESTASLSRMMIGAEPPRLERRPASAGALALSARELTLPAHDRFGVPLEDVSLDVHAGEIVGIAGVSGNGQQELLAALSGEDPRADAGAVQLFGRAHRADGRGRPAAARPALRPRGAARPRRGAVALAREQHAAHPPGGAARVRLDRSRRAPRPGVGHASAGTG